MRYAYPCTIKGDETDGYVTHFPDLPEALTGDYDRAETLVLAEDVLSLALGYYIKMGEPVPAPSAPQPGQVMIAVYPVVAAKLALYTAMREMGLTRAALAKRLSVTDAAVDRMLNPNYRSHIGQVEDALRALGYSLSLSVAPIAERAPAPEPAAAAAR